MRETAAQKVHQVSKNAALTSIDHAHSLGKAVAAPMIQIGQMIPGVSWLTSTPEDLATNMKQRRIDGAIEANSASQYNSFFRTGK